MERKNSIETQKELVQKKIKFQKKRTLIFWKKISIEKQKEIVQKKIKFQKKKNLIFWKKNLNWKTKGNRPEKN